MRKPFWEQLPKRAVTVDEIVDVLPDPEIVGRINVYGCYHSGKDDSPRFDHLLVESERAYHEIAYAAANVSEEPTVFVADVWQKLDSLPLSSMSTSSSLDERPFTYWRAREVAPLLGFDESEFKSHVEPHGVTMWQVAETNAVNSELPTRRATI